MSIIDNNDMSYGVTCHYLYAAVIVNRLLTSIQYNIYIILASNTLCSKISTHFSRIFSRSVKCFCRQNSEFSINRCNIKFQVWDFQKLRKNNIILAETHKFSFYLPICNMHYTNKFQIAIISICIRLYSCLHKSGQV